MDVVCGTNLLLVLLCKNKQKQTLNESTLLLNECSLLKVSLVELAFTGDCCLSLLWNMLAFVLACTNYFGKKTVVLHTHTQTCTYVCMRACTHTRMHTQSHNHSRTFVVTHIIHNPYTFQLTCSLTHIRDPQLIEDTSSHSLLCCCSEDFWTYSTVYSIVSVARLLHKEQEKVLDVQRSLTDRESTILQHSNHIQQLQTQVRSFSGVRYSMEQ